MIGSKNDQGPTMLEQIYNYSPTSTGSVGPVHTLFSTTNYHWHIVHFEV